MTEPVKQQVLELLAEPRSRMKQSIAEELTDVDESEGARALGELVVAGEVKRHPEIEGAFLSAEEEIP